MPRYLTTASQANDLIKEILDFVTEHELNVINQDGTVRSSLRPILSVHLARLFNLGIRVSPRAVHSTVRLNAVVAAMRNLPVKVQMKQVAKTGTDRYGRQLSGHFTGGKQSFNALVLTPDMPEAVPVVEGTEDSEEE